MAKAFTEVIERRRVNKAFPLSMPQSLRLEYRRPTSEDLTFFRAYLSDPVLVRFLPRGKPYSEEAVVDHLQDRIAHWKTHGFGTYLLGLDSKTVGYCGLEYVPNTPHIDLRYGLVQEVWGRGLAVEAVTACLAQWRTLNLAKTFYAAVLPQNRASITVLERVGMTRCDAHFYGDDVLYFCTSL